MNSSSSLTLGKTSLNPHAREFIPTVLRSSSVVATGTGSGAETEPSASSDNGKASLPACATDEESRRYWNAQLPDDILSPEDFFTQDVESSESVTASHVSAYDASVLTGISDDQSAQWEKTMLSGKRVQTSSQIPDYGYSHAERTSGDRTTNKVWDSDQDLASHQQNSMQFDWNSQLINGASDLTHMASLRDQQYKSKDINSLRLFSNEFPGAPSQSMAEIYQAKGGDVNLTSGMLSQLKLRDEGNPCQSISLPSRRTDVSTRKPTFGNVLSNYVEENEQQKMEEFIRLMRTNKMPWLHEKNGIGFGNHQVLSNLLQHGELFGGDFPSMDEMGQAMLQNHQISSRNLLDTDDTLGLLTLITELQEKAQDHARIRNAFFEQAQQAYFNGDKVLVRDATNKGQLHNKLMKLAQSQAAELTFQHRNISSQTPSIGPGQTQLLDLRGFHVNEAMLLLKQELYSLRMLARSTNQHQQVFISVGTGYTKGSRAPSRLLSVVKRHLIENELLNFTEPQPGIIRVLVT